ncbi:hypothetical protein QBC45DRAFT_80224 [Copromyces sp. CBS 386.78]|nr:hypothetical protein QBC45DRAFT_80224 [Copromyces sp. CBS 386.78]
MSASALVRLHQNPGPFPPSTLYGIYGRSSPPLTMADMHGARIIKFRRAYRHSISAVRHKHLLPQHMPGTHELLGLSRTDKPLPGWFPEVPGHLPPDGTSRYTAATAGTTPRFDGIKSFGTSWASRWVGKQTVHPMAVWSLVTTECDKLG